MQHRGLRVLGWYIHCNQNMGFDVIGFRRYIIYHPSLMGILRTKRLIMGTLHGLRCEQQLTQQTQILSARYTEIVDGRA
jgi:hypothetical protein